MPVAAKVRRLVRYAARGSFQHEYANLAMLDRVQRELGPTSTLMTGALEDLGDVIEEVQRHQRDVPGAVPALRDGCQDLSRGVSGDGRFLVRLKGRRSAAWVHTEAAYNNGEGPCTLCPETVHANFPNLLPFCWREFLVWPNPAPIFDGHITFSRAEHIGQTLTKETICSMWEFMDRAPQYRVFHNGPRVGASVAKHQHFQGLIDRLPIESQEVEPVMARDGVSIGYVRGYPARVLVLEGPDEAAIAGIAERLYHAVQYRSNNERYPVTDLNSLFVKLDREGCDIYRAFLFLRKDPGSTCDRWVAIGGRPAAVEMSGVIITSDQARYESLDAADAALLLEDVSSDAAAVRELASEVLEIGDAAQGLFV